MDKTAPGGRFALVLAALGIAGTALCINLAGAGQAAPVGEVGLAAQQGQAVAATKTISIDIAGYAYKPAALSVSPGDTVVWTNQDTAPHNVVVTAGPEKFSSPTLQKGQTFQFTFTKAGSYSYYCSIHPDMKASITVQGATTPPTTTTTTTPGHPTHPTTTTPPTAPPSTTSPPTSPGSGDCVAKEALAPFVAHLKAAHLERSPLEQVNDALDFDRYVKAHTVLLEQMLDPALNQSVNAAVLEPFIAHLKAAHLQRSPLEQVNDALDFDRYVKAHTVLFEQMLDPALQQATC